MGCAVIIVTYNSEKVLPTCLEKLKIQTRQPDQIIIVDSGSHSTSYLDNAANENNLIQLSLQKENVGFCAGNNIGYALIKPDIDNVLFLNPDAFLTPTFIETAERIMGEPNYRQVGALTGLLLGYDIDQQKLTGRIDSSGIFSKWYGKWFDRDQGLPYHPEKYDEVEKIPAICGALMFCRKSALDSVLLGPHEVMDPSFYMYKEDIDLSLRLKRNNWDLLLFSSLIAYHCRGWQGNRRHIDKKWRLMSAKNEMRLFRKVGSPCYLYSGLKYLGVKLFNI